MRRTVARIKTVQTERRK
ncbi:MAG: hypothetical protein PHW87_04790 [Methanothrix sp.]|nr:hypothetical protein [Methanothrix sp.]